MPLPRACNGVLTILAVSAVALIAGCGSDSSAEQAAAPPPRVTVAEMAVESVPSTVELPGRTTPFRIAELRPQVTGIVKERVFTEGSDVKAGQVLYRIDAAPYQAAFDSARASLTRAEAAAAAAAQTARRSAGLFEARAVSAQADEEAQAALQLAQADVGVARAALATARVSLNYTRVTAPIAGRIGRSAVTVGALVTAGQAGALATVQQLDPVYVDLTQSSAELLALKRDLASGALARADGESVPVELVLEDGQVYATVGTLAFSEASVDPETGSVTLRARFANPDRTLLPGMYVRARLTQGVNRNAIRVPHAAVTRDPKGDATVMVVGPDNTVETRTITTAQSLGGTWVVTAGLAVGDRVIVEGLQRVKPGATVAPELAASAAQAGPAQSEAAAPAAPAAR